MKLVVIDREGVRHELPAKPGQSAMEILRDAGLPIDGECNGSLACATCHVWVDEAWIGKLPPPAPDEEDMLDVAFNLAPTSRLSCQIIVSQESDGIVLRVPKAT